MTTGLTLSKNERFWSGQIIALISDFVKHKTLQIKNAGGETTINTRGSVMFPDVILYGDAAQGLVLQGWEIKMPDVSITNQAFRNDAERKARLLGLNSFILWNFTYCKLFVKNDVEVYEEARFWDKTSYINSRSDVELKRSDWECLLKDILMEINDFLSQGILLPRNFDFVISEHLIPEIIARNKSLVADHLESCSKANIVIRNQLEMWWEEVKHEYMSSETSMYAAYAKTIIVDWLNKLVFAHLIGRYHNPARAVNSIQRGISVTDAISIFDTVTKKCDFFNIFKRYQFGDLLPNQCWGDIVEFNVFLSNNGLENIDQTTLQSILERTVVSSRREIIGQFTTPPLLAELLTRITIHDTTGTCLDPCCGTGTIPQQVIKYKIENGNSISEAYETTWAADKFSFPLQVANISLTTPDSINIACRIIQKNVFMMETNAIEEIVNPQNGDTMKIPLPKFNAIVSNLPFIDFNTVQREDAQSINAIRAQIRESTGITLSDRNDTYSYITFSLWKNLSDNGRLGIIISNSWLGTDSGRDFYNALRWFYKIKGVYISGAGAWFDNAKVVTTILILEKKDIGPPNNEEISFGLINKRLSEWEDPLIMNTIARSINLNNVKEKDSSLLSINKLTTNDVESVTAYGLSLNVLFYNSSWISKIGHAVCPIKEIFDVVRGEKTCQDEIFYMKEPDLVDSEYVINGLKNAKKITTLIASPDTDILFCDKTRNELNLGGSTKTLSYLQSFDRTLNVSLSKKGDEWHIFKNVKPVRLFTGMNPYKRIFYGLFEDKSFINQRLIGFLEKDASLDIELCHALLNSILGIFFVEAMGFGMGEGALDINKESFARSYMLNPNLLDSQKINDIKLAFNPLKNREIMDTLIEINCEDRMNFDMVVLKAYGLEDYYEEIKQTLTLIQTTRLSVKK